MSGIGRSDRLRPMLAPQVPDGPVPDEVAKAFVGVLTDWAKGRDGWASGAADAQPRPVGVVTIASRTRPQLINSLGERIAEVDRLPLLGSVNYAGEPRVSRGNSVQRLKALEGTLPCRPPWLPRSPRLPAPSSSWTTSPRPAGRSQSRPARSDVPVPRGCCPWFWPFRLTAAWHRTSAGHRPGPLPSQRCTNVR